MANKTFGDLTEATTLASGDLLAIENAAGNSRKITAENAATALSALALRGALVTKASDETTANYTTTTDVSWDTEGYDTNSIHDNATNNTRLTVPAGVSYIRVSFGVTIGSITADVHNSAVIRKNGTEGFLGNGFCRAEHGSTTSYLNGTTAIIPVTPGDYFTVAVTIETDTSVTLFANRSWFAMEIIA